MKQQFDNPNMMNPKKRSYFTGKKKLKNVKMFEEFLNEVDVKGVGHRTIRAPKILTDLITTLRAEMDETEKLGEEVNTNLGKIKKINAVIEAQKKDVMDLMSKYNALTMRTESALGSLETSMIDVEHKTKLSHSYQGMMEETVERLVARTKEAQHILLEIQEKHTKLPTTSFTKDLVIRKIKEDELIEGNFSDTVNKVVAWFKTGIAGAVNKLKNLLPSYEKSVEDLENIVANITK